MSRRLITPFMQKHLNAALGSAARMMDSTSRGSQPNDYGSNQERQKKVISENDHIFRKSVETILEDGKIVLMPKKAKRLLEWLEINHEEFFSSLDVNDSEEKVEISYEQ